MTAVTYRAQALGPLGKVDWTIPDGVSVVVGPNRVGKSTLLKLPQLIGLVLLDGLGEAFKSSFGGVPHLRNLRVSPSLPMSLGLATTSLDWEVELAIRDGQIGEFPFERLRLGGRNFLSRKPGSRLIEGDNFEFRHTKPIPSLFIRLAEDMKSEVRFEDLAGILDQGDPVATDKLRGYLPVGAPDEVLSALSTMVSALKDIFGVLSFRSYDYEIKQLQRFGSVQSSEVILGSQGQNVFPLLRNWRDKPELEERFDFVISNMREIFPHLGRVGFDQAGQTSTMSVSDRRWPGNASIPISRESTGFIVALLHLCGLASCMPGGLVTFDEIETSLHPRAIRLLIEACRRRAASHNIRVIIATQSQTVLDQFRDEPSHVFVLEPDQETSPKALTEMFSPEYLSQFSLGDLFAHLEFGGDEPPA